MITADTSTWINFYEKDGSIEAENLTKALESGSLVMLPPVLTELLSSIYLSEEDKQSLTLLPRVDLILGYWERAGRMRCELLKKKFKARTLDCLIAQICIDHKIPLITHDQDFRHFIQRGLILVFSS